MISRRMFRLGYAEVYASRQVQIRAAQSHEQSEVGAAVSESDREYTEIPKMIGALRALDEDSPAYRRQHEAIVERTLPLARHIARRFRGRGQPDADLYQVACLGLLNAINRFDPDTGGDFLSFAVPTTMGEVRRHFRDFGWAVKVPRRLKDLQRQLARARDELTRDGRGPTATQIANHLGIDRESVVEGLIASTNYSTLSTDVQRSVEDDFWTIGARSGELDPGYEKVTDIEALRPLIAALSERERTILTLRFFRDMSQTQIAQRIGCSQMHVSRLLTKALGTLRNQLVEADAQASADNGSAAAVPTKQHQTATLPRQRHRSAADAPRAGALAS
jgi:RNA polymerase sigma-B factor